MGMVIMSVNSWQELDDTRDQKLQSKKTDRSRLWMPVICRVHLVIER